MVVTKRNLIPATLPVREASQSYLSILMIAKAKEKTTNYVDIQGGFLFIDRRRPIRVTHIQVFALKGQPSLFADIIGSPFSKLVPN
ncbi:hypothetical protein F8388_002600 [Cannabis sativa]|uniref:Uncharacterized protein n=1 Tax=Cannabis sativa TaxID=3483 RepID=A0A7J6FDN4_CANSA|nr:hypothetical protein F8388_002600 [Cannabis sativa]